jgi:hypothetical protein
MTCINAGVEIRQRTSARRDDGEGSPARWREQGPPQKKLFGSASRGTRLTRYCLARNCDDEYELHLLSGAVTEAP